MSTEYRVRYKKGDTEIEIQSGEKEYVNSMFDKLMTMISRHHELPAIVRRTTSQRSRPKVQSGNAGSDATQDTTVDAADIANKVNEADNHTKIVQHILNKPKRLPKVLLAFHFAHECGFDQLTSGDVEKITDELGVKVEHTSASHCISDNRRFFSAGAARRRGAKIRYKLNHQGEQTYKKVLDTGKV